MRLAQLDLIRFGRFTDKSIALPIAARDLHIVFGPNEAGKTTALTAIEDSLFGIPARSPYNFLHDYDAMRIGAVLESGADKLEFRRRKGTKSTVVATKNSVRHEIACELPNHGMISSHAVPD